jgi:nitrite reductase/ring-hydroxylating ferredoxin subunit
MSSFVRAAALKDLADGACLAVTVEARKLLLCRRGEQVFAVDNRCSHAGSDLDGGAFEGFELECPWHGARFDVRSGKACGPPAYRPIGSYETKIEGEDVLVLVKG